MHAVKLASIVEEDQSVRIQEVPFRAGSAVEVIVLSGEPDSTGSPESNSEEAREEALRFLLDNPVPLGGLRTKRDDLYDF